MADVMLFWSAVVSASLGLAMGPAPAKQPAGAATKTAKPAKSDPSKGAAKDAGKKAATPATAPADQPAFDPTALVPKSSIAPTTPALVQQCNGTRGAAKPELRDSDCSQWRIEWSEGGQVRGVTSATSRAALEAERELLLTFDRRYSTLFGVAVDARLQSASAPICVTCRGDSAAGRWGDGQRFSGQPIDRATASTQGTIDRLEAALLSTHAASIEAVARLSKAKRTSAKAKAYAKQIHAAMGDLIALQLALENAAIMHDTPEIEKIGRTAGAHSDALDRSRAALGLLVATEVASAHAGTYGEEGTSAAPAQMVVAIEGSVVTATYVQGAAKSVWFEGSVALDGSVSGKSLMAPEGKALTCNSHSLECGYAYIPSILRFSSRPSADKDEVLELWFKQSKWVQAKPFAR